ncbi:MAG: hypothetical protein ABW000_22625 [Actinoplanes sp.]
MVEKSGVTVAFRLARQRCAGASGADDQLESLCELLWALARIGDRDATVRVADRLVRATVDAPSESGNWNPPAIAQKLAGVGLFDQAEQLIAALPHGWSWGEAQGTLAQLLVGAGDTPRAERIVDAITDVGPRSNALIELVDPLTEAGDRVAARRATQRAQESIAAETYSEDQARKLNHLTQVLLADYPAEARQVARRAEEFAAGVSDPSGRDRARSSAVHALALTGQFDRAERLIAGITDQSVRESSVLKLACALGDAGDFDRGLRLAATITDVGMRGTTQEQLVRSLARAGEFGRAKATAAVIESPSARADALGELAGALSAAGDRAGAGPVVDEAEEAALAIGYPASRGMARHWLVEELIDAGDFALAERTARRAADPAHELGRVGRAMAEAGDRAGARRVLDLAEPHAMAITEPDARAWALSSLADDLAVAGAVEHAVRVLVEATGTGPWYRALGTAAVVAPDAVRSLAEDVLGASRPVRRG